MCATLTDDDVGKLVERADGKVIGSIATVESGRAQVEPEPDALDSILSRFGWAETFDPFVLEGRDVDEITESRVLLAEGAPSGDERSATTDDRTTTADERSTTAGERSTAAGERERSDDGAQNRPDQ